MKISQSTFIALLLFCALPPRADAQLEPDKRVFSVGKWVISTARFGVGCVATLNYANWYEVSISGDRFDDLTLLVTVDPKRFSTKVDGSEESTPHIEVALKDNRWGDVQPYGYRGTPGVVLKIDSSFLSSFIRSKQLKVSELGAEKLAIQLMKPTEVLAKLRQCFDIQ
jgi:hypothetical protein